MILPFFVQAGLVKLAAISLIPNHDSKNELFFKHIVTQQKHNGIHPPPPFPRLYHDGGRFRVP